MPNHIHLLWQQNKPNGKETPKGSLLKYTGHEKGHSYLYEVNAANKQHEIWQRDSLGFETYTSKVARTNAERNYLSLNFFVVTQTLEAHRPLRLADIYKFL